MPKDNVNVAIADGVRYLANQLMERTKQFKNQDGRRFLRNNPTTDGL